MRAADLVKLDILINGDPTDALSAIIHRDKAYDWGRELCHRLKDLIPRQMFEVVIQAAIGTVSSHAKSYGPSARMSWPNAMVATSRASASC